MTVSNEDRESARNEAATQWVHAHPERYERWPTEELRNGARLIDVLDVAAAPWMRSMIDGLVENCGWGPRPRVNRRELLGDIVGLSGWGADEIVDRLRECGIEVSGD